MTDSTQSLDWNDLTENHRRALRILSDEGGPVHSVEPRSFKTACHDLWRFGLAERRFNPLTYKITFLGRRVLKMLREDRP